MSRQLTLLFLLISTVIIQSCGGGGGSGSSGVANDSGDDNSTGGDQSALTLTYVSSPIPLNGISAKFAQDVAYDDFSLTTFDIFLPTAIEPTGLIIYIHSGGFTTGDKSDSYAFSGDEIRTALSQGVAFASINYRLVGDGETVGIDKSLNDSRRALQFIRYYAEGFNIDPQSIALYGSSAGGGASLWLAYSDDMADSTAEDPILRESTRVSAVAARETQATYDLFRWQTDVFADYGITVDGIVSAIPETLWLYGLESADQLNSNAVESYRRRVDMLDLMTLDDPDTWVANTVEPAGRPQTTTNLYHHAFHARELKERADFIGLPMVAYIPVLGISDASDEEAIDFLLRHIL